MGINGHSLTFEQKVLRFVEAKYFNVLHDNPSDDDLRRFIDTKLTKSDLLAIQSNVLEEIFKQ